MAVIILKLLRILQGVRIYHSQLATTLVGRTLAKTHSLKAAMLEKSLSILGAPAELAKRAQRQGGP
jgi:hypothetical protein